MTKQYILLLFSCLIIFGSCSQKLYFLDAEKQEYEIPQNEKNDIIIEAYFAGEVMDYHVFEIDVYNKSQDSLTISFQDAFLKIYENQENEGFETRALNKEKIIDELKHENKRVKREKRANNILNGISLGLTVFGGVTNVINGADAIYLSAETASIMIEDARVYKLISGSIEEQIEYVDKWVLYNEKVAPLSETTFDVFFKRNLIEADADFKLHIRDSEYAIPFTFKLKEDKRR